MTGDWRATFGGAAAVSTYEELLVPRLFEPLAEQLLDVADVQPGDRLLDVACGPGTVALAAARRGARVTGCDLSPVMLDLARAKSSDIEWIETSAAPLVGVPDVAFDVVTCQQGLQFFPDRPAAVAEMYRVLVPGGRVAAAVWGPIERSPEFAALAAALREVIGDEAADRYRSGPWGFPDPAVLGALLVGAGFADVRVEQHTISAEFEGGPAQLLAVLGTSPVADDLGRADDEKIAALLAAIERHTAGVADSTRECNVATGTKP